MLSKTVRRPSPAIIVAIIALVAALAGSAVALPGKNSVKSNDIAKNAIKSKHVKNNKLTGADINESKLGKVPSAASADSAGAVAYEKTFNLRLAFGDDVEIASNGTVSLRAECVADGVIDGSINRQGIRIYGKTTAPGAFLAGDNDDYEGDDDGDGPEAGEYLEPTDQAPDAELSSVDNSSGGNPEQRVENEIDHGFIASADGKYIGIDGEKTLLAVRAFGSDCAAIGTVDVLG
jgi:hypothetical protein